MGKVMRTISKRFWYLVFVVAGLLLSLTVLGVLSSDNFTASQYWGALWVCSILLVFVGIRYRRSILSGYRALCRKKWLVFACFALLVFVQLCVFTTITGRQLFDAGMVYDGVFNDDKTLINQYLSIWQNNLPMYTAENIIKHVFHLSDTIIALRIYTVISCLLYDIGFIFIAWSVFLLSGMEAAVLSGLICFGILGLTNQVYQIYSTAFSWPFTCFGIFVYIYLKKAETCGRASKIIGSFCFGMTVTCGYMIRPSSVIYVIAIAMFEFPYFWNYVKNVKTSLFVVLPVIFGICLTVLAYYAVESRQGIVIDETRNATMQQYLAYGITGNGDGDIEIRKRIEGTSSVEERKSLSVQIWLEEIKRKGPVGYTAFLAKKHILNTSDAGMKFTTPHIEEQYSSNKIKHFFQDIYYTDGKYGHLTVYAIQLIYLLVLVGVAYGVLETLPEVHLFCLALVGYWVFLLIFEAGRSVYSIQAFPVLIMMSAIGWHSLIKVSTTQVKCLDASACIH